MKFYQKLWLIFTRQYKNLSNRSKNLIFFSLIFGILALITQVCFIVFYHITLPFTFIPLILLNLFAYFFINTFSLLISAQLDVTTKSLEQEKYYNLTLNLLHDNVRTFRHDFGNIIQSIGGYIDTNNMQGLQEYYKQLQVDCEDIKSLEMLNPSTISEPAIYSLLTAKYNKAASLGILMKIHVSLDLDNLNMKIYEFTRILAILLDNAIEGCEKCEEKIINFEIKRDEKCPRQLILIQNTYFDKNINLNRIKEKGYTSKKDKSNPHGLGLWEVDKIIKKSKNLNLFTTKDSIFFTQQLELYDK